MHVAQPFQPNPRILEPYMYICMYVHAYVSIQKFNLFMVKNEKEMETKCDTKLLLVTANVGSLFEDPSRLQQIWLKEFLSKVSEIQPMFVGLHLQEVGGKTYEKSMEFVQEFIQSLCDSMTDYTFVRIYMDEDFKSAEHFTALGNMYFVHTDLQSLRVWNFLTHDWENNLNKTEDKHVYSGNIETIPTKDKSKFPQHFFPECKWSRKGFMRTRWEINGTAIDLVNIHLFHDASNLAACEEFPSVYCKTRRRALVHTLERFYLDDKNGTVPFFLFGDFNFRCDTEGVVKELTQNLTIHRVQSVKNENTKVHYRNITGNNVLTVGKKEFSHADHQLKFKEDWLKNFDRELEPLKDILIEYPITFVPSYPFEEDPEMPTDYMSTRCPSWCDRILMSPHVKDVLTEDWEQMNYQKRYNLIGEAVCMGDHKPVYLTVHLKPNKGLSIPSMCSIEVPESLKALVNEMLGDEILWMEQSHVEERLHSKSHYIAVKSIAFKDPIQDEGNAGECKGEIIENKPTLLKETTV
ncbi:inositol polyphosphate-5-phosphatase A isoform X2 [Scaptodrosophila lebanonensis]|uniref:inositol-polyphosphate 5-phosphatase n=1 Tax=Drosophila lebanonensis TaxID=7225 RepID=A0A6J2SZQ8_DROLE|nr:inositol polyphosphate-5-phosphatase A isoform X2 [Scaptodrosophila lebanonensis]